MGLVRASYRSSGYHCWGLLYKRSQDKTKRRIAEERAQNEREIATDRLLESTLQTYLDRMTELLLYRNLRTSEPDAEVRDVARVWTFTILRRLDEKRKGIVLDFLHRAGLISIGLWTKWLLGG